MGRTPQSPARRKLYALCTELGLTREERLDWATLALRRDLASFDDVDESQVLRLLDQAEGFGLISEIYRQRLPAGEPDDQSDDHQDADDRPDEVVDVGHEPSGTR